MLDNRDGVLQNLISVIPFFILLNYRQRPYLTDSVITNDVGKNYILNSLHTLHPADDMHEYFSSWLGTRIYMLNITTLFHNIRVELVIVQK